jgi:hypothetical protein
MKQTAVEWLVENLPYPLSLNKEGLKKIEQAKEMEKEQKHSEYMRGWYDGVDITK